MYSRNENNFGTDMQVPKKVNKKKRRNKASHRNTKQKVFVGRFPLDRFLAKPLRVNKITMKSFLKNLSFGVDFKL